MTKQLFIDFVRDNQGAVRRYLIALCCGDSALADDLAQDTFMKAYLNLGNFRADSKLSTWIFKIAHNVFISHGRTVRQNVPLSEFEGMPPADERSVNPFRYEALYSALSELTDGERSVIVLYYLQGYSVAEIAEITGHTTAAVKKQMERGRRHLRGLLTNS